MTVRYLAIALLAACASDAEPTYECETPTQKVEDLPCAIAREGLYVDEQTNCVWVYESTYNSNGMCLAINDEAVLIRHSWFMGQVRGVMTQTVEQRMGAPSCVFRECQ